MRKRCCEPPSGARPLPQRWETRRPSWASPLLSGPLRGRQTPRQAAAAFSIQPPVSSPASGLGSLERWQKGVLLPLPCCGKECVRCRGPGRWRGPWGPEGGVGTRGEGPSAARPRLFLRKGLWVVVSGPWDQVTHRARQEVVSPSPDQRPPSANILPHTAEGARGRQPSLPGPKCPFRSSTFYILCVLRLDFNQGFLKENRKPEPFFLLKLWFL